MITIDLFDRRPMQPGDRREMILSGDGPFRITNSCFVDTPPPPGFRPCSACNSVVILEGKSHFVAADRLFWTGKEGAIEIAIQDALGESLTIHMTVITVDKGAPHQMIVGA